MGVKFPEFCFNFLGKVERVAGYAQGKGYGTATINQEVESLTYFVKATPKLAIDIGGNVGDYTAELRRLYPNMEIHTFEPSVTNIDKLTDRFKEDRLIKIIPLAVSDTSGEAVLFADKPGSGLGSLTKRRLDHKNIIFDNEETIKTIRFEEYWCNDLDCRDIDLVKIDIEGHELSALMGFGEAIKAVKILQFEFGGSNIDTRTFFQDFWYYFNDHGFDLYRITPFGPFKLKMYNETEEVFTISNIIAVNQ